jgi:hypothetical protein
VTAETESLEETFSATSTEDLPGIIIGRMQGRFSINRPTVDVQHTSGPPRRCHINRWLLSFFFAASSATLAATPDPAPEVSGDSLHPPARQRAPGAPLVFEHSVEAGPDETFLLVGENLTTNVLAWGLSANHPGGQEWKPQVQFVTNGLLAATLPERAQDGPFLLWVKNDAGWSEPLVLNQPQPWWCGPDLVSGGEQVRVFGRNLARRPDGVSAAVYLCQAGRKGTWANVAKAGKYSVTFRVPTELATGEYQVWLHAGAGGEWGWGGPVKLKITKAPKSRSSDSTAASGPKIELTSSAHGAEIQRALDEMGERGGGLVLLRDGKLTFSGTLRIPAGVSLRGKGKDRTSLELVRDASAPFPRLSGSGWNQAPGAVHTPGDTIEYELAVPKSGRWTVWLRYATDMKPWNQPGVSGNHTLAVDNAPPVALMNLENTSGWGAFQWSKSATMDLTAGKHKLVWKNMKGGGVSLDAFVFALDPEFRPTMSPPPTNDAGLIVLQAEDCVRFVTKEGNLPGGDRAAVWLAGNGASLSDLSILGDAQVNVGIAIRSPQSTTWLTNCHVERVRVADCDGKQGENCGLLVRYVDHARVADNELWGRAPLFISGARQSEFTHNRLVSVSRFGGNAEAAILGRNETIEECVVEDNVIASPSGAEAGSPTARRLLWFSTGHGSITRNWIANNGVEKANGPGADTGAGQARFGGVAGTDQNVGEMILFEANHRTAYFGPLASADASSVTLPKTITPTPDDRLGNVTRAQLAHDQAGNETPFWPPDLDDGTEEPPISEYYVSIFSGRGQGQTRRVLKREGERLLLDKPWAVAPKAGSVIAVGTAFYRNFIVGNRTPDGMTGIQLWISCVENVIAGNSIARQRKPGLFLYANGTTLASSMSRTWNRGISPLFWNVAEGNYAEECSAGALVTSGDEGRLPIEFPRTLGNELRHNSFVRNRTDGVILVSRRAPAGAKDITASIVGSIVEFNVVRDATVGYHAGASCDAVVFRRNHAYFWYPVNGSTNPPVAFQVDDAGTSVAIERNSIEGIHGVHDDRIIDLKKPEGVVRLPE